MDDRWYECWESEPLDLRCNDKLLSQLRETNCNDIGVCKDTGYNKLEKNETSNLPKMIA